MAVNNWPLSIWTKIRSVYLSYIMWYVFFTFYQPMVIFFFLLSTTQQSNSIIYFLFIISCNFSAFLHIQYFFYSTSFFDHFYVIPFTNTLWRICNNIHILHFYTNSMYLNVTINESMNISLHYLLILYRWGEKDLSMSITYQKIKAILASLSITFSFYSFFLLFCHYAFLGLSFVLFYIMLCSMRYEYV